jgi:C1A family cysteine protease
MPQCAAHDITKTSVSASLLHMTLHSAVCTRASAPAAPGAIAVDSHAIQLVGYDLEQGWWLAKNSWGTKFAEGASART